MRVSKRSRSDCMSQSRKLRRIKVAKHPDIDKPSKGNRVKNVERRIAELLFENCSHCGRMAAIPQGAFVACKVRRNLERSTMITSIKGEEKQEKENAFSERPPLEGLELTPLKYNSKLMNSIWGLYNRYSVHNFKMNNDTNEGVVGKFVAVLGEAFYRHASATNAMTTTVVAENNS